MPPIPPFRGTRNNHWIFFQWTATNLRICLDFFLWSPPKRMGGKFHTIPNLTTVFHRENLRSKVSDLQGWNLWAEKFHLEFYVRDWLKCPFWGAQVGKLFLEPERTNYLDLLGRGLRKKWPKNIPPNGGEKWCFVTGKMRKKSHQQNKSKNTKGLLTMIP